MRPRVEALLNDPDAIARGVHVVSGFRSIERQRELYDAAVRKYGRAGASRWVAPPGRSNHGPKVDGYGIAVDFGISGVHSVGGQWPRATANWFQNLARRHGLFQRMAWESWHYEPIVPWSHKDVKPDEEDDDLKSDEKMMLYAIYEEIYKDDKPGNAHELLRRINSEVADDGKGGTLAARVKRLVDALKK